MTTQQVAQMLESIGLPYAYGHFTEADSPGAPPFICFLYTGTRNFAADDRVFQKIVQLSIELYTDEKDFALERAVEAALDAADLFWESDETFIESERMYEVIYSTEIALTEE